MNRTILSRIGVAGLQRSAPASGLNVTAGNLRLTITESNQVALGAAPSGELRSPPGRAPSNQYFAADRHAAQAMFDEQVRSGIQPQIFNIDNRWQECFLWGHKIFHRPLLAPAIYSHWCARHATP